MKWTISILFYNFLPVMCSNHPDIGLTFEQKVKRQGYPVEIHQVVTEDDYLLCLYRIPYGLKRPKNETKRRSPVLLVHGMGGAATNWIILGPKDSISYYLVDKGFDVWIVNTRGTMGCLPRKHKKYDWNNDQEYWDYSLHEIGVKDLPATIDYIRRYTKQQKLFYIGHSAGGPELFIMLSEKPEYNKKIKIGTLYGSSPILKKIDMPLVLFASYTVDLVKGIFKYLKMSEAFPPTRIISDMAGLLCRLKEFQKACKYVIDAIGSHSSVLIDENTVPLIASESYSRLSSGQIIHYLENIKYGEFRKYNYGPKLNLKLYGDVIPPKYNFSSCTAPVAFFRAPQDSFCVEEDLTESINNTPNVILSYLIPFDKFNHADFIFARNVTYLLHEPTYRLFKDYDDGKVSSKRKKQTRN